MQVFNLTFKLFSKASKCRTLYQSKVVRREQFACRVRDAHTENVGKNLSSVQSSKLNGTTSNTLQSRILNYFKTNRQYVNIDSSNAEQLRLWMKHAGLLQDKPLDQQHELICSFDNKQLAQLILYQNVHNSKFLASENQFNKFISFLDGECSNRLHTMKQQDVLLFLYAWMNFVPNKIIHLKFYHAILPHLKKWLTDPNLSMQNYIQIIFYSGLKKTSQNAKQIMQLGLDFIHRNNNDQTMSIEELCVVTNAFFKTGTKIDSQKLLNTITATLYKNLDILLLDPALFVTLIKALRHAQIYDYILLDTISMKFLSRTSGNQETFTAKAHLLALYAGALYSKCEIISALIESCQRDLKATTTQIRTTKKSDHLSIQHRSKDLCRFLWSVSCLNYTLDPDFVAENIIPELNYRYSRGDYNYKPNELIDSLLSLWILGFKTEKLLLNILSRQTISTFQRDNKIRYNSRLALLLTCASIEAPGILNNEQMNLKNSLSKINEPNMSKTLTSRPLFRKVYDVVNSLSSALEVTKVLCKYAIPHLHIAGIEIHKGKHNIFIEVLDPTVCLYKSPKPHGLMQLKIRLMKALHGQPIIIDTSDVENLHEGTSIYEVVEEKISIACK